MAKCSNPDCLECNFDEAWARRRIRGYGAEIGALAGASKGAAAGALFCPVGAVVSGAAGAVFGAKEGAENPKGAALSWIGGIVRRL